MKKVFICFILGFILSGNISANAHHCGSYSYLIGKDYHEEKYTFTNCDKHSVIEEISVYYYSNGTRRYYKTSTIFNADGSILVSGCSDVKHFIQNKKHYFTFYKNKKYQIIDENGNYLTIKNYKMMDEIAPNRLLVKLDKKFGVINIDGNIITPIKYKKFEQVNTDLFITKLNGYFGMIDSSNNILIKNEYDKIKQLYNVFIIKKYNKFGIVNINGEIILQAEFDNIKKLGEYIIVKKNGRYGVLDSNGNIIANPIYKKIQLNRNTLKGKLPKKDWITLL
ncbi:WG repeat-containing protein [bacterium]|nr:WG repeat-containing protein [bacterium]